MPHFMISIKMSLKEKPREVLFCANFVSFLNLIFVWFISYLDAAPVLRQGHISRVCPRFVGEGRKEPEGPNWGLSVGDALQHIGTYFRIDSVPTV